ncbi:hypothetical protein Dsin_022375 [Dipteronia sinensis]|uniref:Uncharacterized protein n=1 Tax=Dipteronia sinensis TaxID=43782 RepID=A0AAE0A1E4_9ROSI|nr:hypothetical protein Dsin_022375 [Dipteronia sinensis]
MSFYGSSYISSSSSSSSNSNDDLTSLNYVQNMDARLEEMDEVEALLHQLYTKNNLLVAQCLNKQNYQPRRRGGAVHGHRVINRDREGAQRNLWNDYFADNPRYNDVIFRRRFRMERPLFFRIVNAVENHDGYFVQRRDVVGRLGLTSLQKITAVFRMFARRIGKLWSTPSVTSSK